MTIKTFDANRVGGGTFQLEQDATTGEYKIKEVGFVKLPELKLPEIDQAAYKTPTPYIPGTDPDPDTDLPDVGGGGSDGGGGGDQQDFTGASTLKNIGKEATGDSANLMNQATTFAGQDTDIQVEDIGNNPERNTALKAYNEAIDNYNKVTANIRELNASGQATDVSRRAYDISRNNAQKQLDDARKEYEYRSGLDLEGTASSETIKAAPVISEDLQKFGPTTVTGATGVPDAIVQGQPALPDENIITKAKDIVSNSKPVQLIGVGARIAGTVLKGAATAIFGPETNSQVHAKNYFTTRGDLGSSSDPQRIVGDPTKNVFAGANANAKNLERYSQKRIDMIEKNLAAGKYKDPAEKRERLETFKKQQDEYRRDRIADTVKRKGLDTKNPNEMRQTDGGADSSPGGKIVCTMMNESYGFGSFRNKIWMKFHSDIAPEYQKGYHKLFLPLVNYAKQKGITNKIIKNILEHIAVHSTIDMRQTLRGKTHLLGRVYRKVILPLCYWAGRK